MPVSSSGKKRETFGVKASRGGRSCLPHAVCSGCFSRAWRLRRTQGCVSGATGILPVLSFSDANAAHTMVDWLDPLELAEATHDGGPHEQLRPSPTGASTLVQTDFERVIQLVLPALTLAPVAYGAALLGGFPSLALRACVPKVLSTQARSASEGSPYVSIHLVGEHQKRLGVSLVVGAPASEVARHLLAYWGEFLSAAIAVPCAARFL